MFGELTKTSSRIAIAASLGFTLGMFALGTHPAKAADLDGDCCADLEERVAKLEATQQEGLGDLVRLGDQARVLVG